MITEERLLELETSPREAMLFKAEMLQLTAAYRNQVPGLRVLVDSTDVWLCVEAPSGKKALFNLEAFGKQRVGIAGSALLEVVNALRQSSAQEGK